MPNPRDQLLDNLNQQLDQFFGAGKTAEQVPAGVSVEREAMFGTSHSNKLRLERNKLAPRMKELAKAGKTVTEAATEMGIASKRARLIAKENRITFPGLP